MRRLRTMAGWESSSPITLQIKTVPADADPYALRVARAVGGWFQTAGIETQVMPTAAEELHRQVLLNNEFDLFIARMPSQVQSPDILYSLLHSRFVEAPGWQNPFGFTNLDVDDLLETQRRVGGEARREAVARVQETIARTQPFSILAFPDDVRAARSTNFTNWRAADLRSPFGYLMLDNRRAGEAADQDPETTTPPGGNVLRVAMTDRRATENLNPLAVEFRRSGVLTGLLYDSLGYTLGGEPAEPWLANSWAFTRGNDGPRARVRLRVDLTWHDGEPLTAEDVAFTHTFLADTSLGADDPWDDDWCRGRYGNPDPSPSIPGEKQSRR